MKKNESKTKKCSKILNLKELENKYKLINVNEENYKWFIINLYLIYLNKIYRDFYYNSFFIIIIIILIIYK